MKLLKIISLVSVIIGTPLLALSVGDMLNVVERAYPCVYVIILSVLVFIYVIGLNVLVSKFKLLIHKRKQNNTHNS